MDSLPRKKAKMTAEEESGDSDDVKTERDEQEQVLLALIEHRTKEVERNKWRVSHYTAELEQSQRKLEETKHQLSRLRGQNNFLAPRENSDVGKVKIKVEEGSTSPCQYIPQSPENQSKSILVPLPDSVKSSKKSQVDVIGVSSGTLLQRSERSSENKAKCRPEVVIPALNSETAQPSKSHIGTKASNGPDCTPAHGNNTATVSGVNSVLVDIQSKGTKRKIVQKEHQDLISLIAGSSSVRKLQCQTNGILPSQHKRKLRSLALCPSNDQLFVTSALDGVVNLWQLQAKGSRANCLSSTDCLSIKGRRWPEDIAWHPQGKSLVSVFSADGGDSQVAVLDLNKGKEKRHVNFLEDKPHIKGIINNIVFMPWEDTCFVTAGTDHAVVLWTENNGIKDWNFKTLHRNLHSSAVMGVAGLQHKKVVLSAGLDKRITGFDVVAGRADYKHQIETKCLSIVPNPCDFNLYMIQTGTIGEQLRLFDYRVRQTELHTFGWEQETSESQSALINQAWSPDGLYITSGSVDPMIHIFDIRYNATKPTQSIRAHQKRVFKAVWHSTLPLLISISSDLNIGLHKIT